MPHPTSPTNKTPPTLSADQGPARVFLEENARFLALVPDMLLALEAVAKGSSRKMGEDSCGNPFAHIRLASLEKVHAVLAKATGGI